MNRRTVPRILMLTAEYGPLHVGGLGSFLTSLCKGMNKARFQPVVALPRSSYEVPWDLVAVRDFESCRAHIYRVEGVEVWLLSNELLDQTPIFLPTSKARTKKFDDFGERVAELLPAMDVSVVHLHDSFGYKCLGEAASLSLPTVFTVHRLHRDLPSEFFAEMVSVKLADVVTTVGRSYAEDNGAFFGPGREVVAIPNSIDTDYFRFESPEDITLGRAARLRALLGELGLPERVTFAYIGRLDADQKGLDVLLEAHRGLHGAGDFNLIVTGVGSPALAGELRALADEMPSHVRFLGRALSREEVRRYLSAIDLALMPSRYEPFGIVQLEAQAMGAVMVASATGGLKDVIIDVDRDRDRGFGRLFPNGDAAALGRALEEMARLRQGDPARIDAMRIRASETAQRYTDRVMAERYEALYRSILGERSGR